MEFSEVVRRRRMHRSFEPTLIPRDALDRILDAGRRAPSAGHSQGWAFVVLEGPEATGRYWDVTVPPGPGRAEFDEDGTRYAPVLVIPLANAQAYVDRYAEPDKRAAGLGRSAGDWPVPYWTVDTAFAAMLMLLAAVDEGLGALFFGIQGHQAELMKVLGVPANYEPIGTIAIGHPRPGGSTGSAWRGRRPLEDVVHRGGW
ncbi:MAG: nitroreductase family protein [Acidimicrobiales bacterium]